ncbi:MAG: hypothetical protein JXB39_04835 [Deltaproteobacteria bacterium]|nr:hypothetical protein [Deltaproteobacteria bacterium]
MRTCSGESALDVSGAERGSHARRPLGPFLLVGLATGGFEVAIEGQTRLGLDLPDALAWLAASGLSWGVLASLVGLGLRVALPSGPSDGPGARLWPGRRTGIAAAVALTVAFFVIAERNRGPTPPLDRGAEHTSTAPDVLLLTFEQADPTRFLEPGSGPTWDRLLGESAVLDRVAVPEGSIDLALLTLMTGAIAPGAGRPASGPVSSLAYDRSTSSLVELLQGDGYLAGGFTTSPLEASCSEWRRAFDVYDDRAGGLPGVSRSRVLGPVLGPRPSSPVLADRCVERAVGFYRGAGSHRVFLWIHLPIATHGSGSLGVDAAVGRILAVVEAEERLDETLLVVGLLPPEAEASVRSSRNPGAFLVRYPVHAPPGTRVACEVELRDIQPTVADLLGNLTQNLGGGQSLGPTLAGAPCPKRRRPPRASRPWAPGSPPSPRGPP